MLNSQLTVDSTGSIYVPNVGPVHVAGLKSEQLESQIKSQISHTLRNFDLSASLGHLRSIQVYVVGEARRPGLYTVSSLSTALNVLFASGGPSSSGSLRRIQINRSGKVVGVVDLYDLILRGNSSTDLRLESGDIVFIPHVGSQAALGGSVLHPAIYELSDNTSFRDLLDLGGGLLPTASSGQITLERINQDGARQATTVDQRSAMFKMPVLNGDVIIAGHISLGFEKTVTLRGNLANPGQFPWHENMHLSDIIPDRMSLLTRGYWEARNSLGQPSQLFDPLKRSNKSDIPNRIGNVDAPDRGYQANGLTEKSQIESSNGNDSKMAVQLQNSESIVADEPIAELQQASSGQNVTSRAQKIDVRIPAPEIDWSYAVIERLNTETLRNSLIPFNLGRLVINHDNSQDLLLEPGDVVTILSQADTHVGQDDQTKYIHLEGEFVSSGTYSVKPNETLADVVARAGGLTAKAYLYGASFTRETARVQQQQRLDEYVNSVAMNLERSSAIRAVSNSVADATSTLANNDLIKQMRQLRATGRIVLEFEPYADSKTAIPPIPLEDGDVFRVPSRPLTVSVIGSVYGPNVFLYDQKRRVQDYLLLAGSPNRLADRNRAFIIRADGSVFSHERAQGIWTNTFNFQILNPGDTIVVPEKEIKPSSLRQFTDYSSIFSSVALGAASLSLLK